MLVTLIEDDPTMAQPMMEGLSRHGFQVRWAQSGLEGLETARGSDLVLLDLGLPDVDGLDVCRDLRARSDVPIIIVSARGHESDRVQGLELGADDYVVKPFSMRELAARIRANVRRRPASASVIEHGDLTIDRDRRVVTAGEEELVLTPKEFELLTVLAEEPGRVVPRTELYARIWDPVWVGSGKSLDVHVATLRRKLPESVEIKTMRGVGYCLTPADQA